MTRLPRILPRLSGLYYPSAVKGLSEWLDAERVRPDCAPRQSSNRSNRADPLICISAV